MNRLSLKSRSTKKGWSASKLRREQETSPWLTRNGLLAAVKAVRKQGCPELSVVIDLLSKLTNREFNDLVRRPRTTTSATRPEACGKEVKRPLVPCHHSPSGVARAFDVEGKSCSCKAVCLTGPQTRVLKLLRKKKSMTEKSVHPTTRRWMLDMKLVVQEPGRPSHIILATAGQAALERIPCVKNSIRRRA